MSRFLRYPVRRLGDHVGLGLFAMAYLAVPGITFAPAGTFSAGGNSVPLSLIVLP